MTPGWIRPLFVLAAAYDVVLGAVFGLGFKPIMSYFGIALPNHDAYAQLPAALIAIFGIGFGFVAAAPEKHRDMILLGILMKLAFSGIVFAHFWAGNMPNLWTWFAGCDVAFLLAFLAAWRALGVVRSVRLA